MLWHSFGLQQTQMEAAVYFLESVITAVSNAHLSIKPESIPPGVLLATERVLRLALAGRYGDAQLVTLQVLFNSLVSTSKHPDPQ